MNNLKWTKYLISIASIVWSSSLLANESVCHGKTSHGRLDNGVVLPLAGDNFTHYSLPAVRVGRTYVHSTVRDIIINSYSELKTLAPSKQFMYAETGFKNGGRFKPHRTHQNGLSVDFMVPVIDGKGRSQWLPTSHDNRWGYDIEFDAKGKFANYTIDYAAMATHIKALREQALLLGVDIDRVIFDPTLQPFLFSTPDGAYLKKHVSFSKQSVWWRHDEHYHVDFLVACKVL